VQSPRCMVFGQYCALSGIAGRSVVSASSESTSMLLLTSNGKIL
jgi:hypothetical protein